jgi:diguanylate cyclase (GGDEF)-like protein
LDQSQQLTLIVAFAVLAIPVGIVLLLYWWRRRDRDRGSDMRSSAMAPATVAMGGSLVAAAMPSGMGSVPAVGAAPVRAEQASSTDEHPTTDDEEDDLVLEGEGLIDPATGLGTALAWDFALRHEEARFARYKESATVVVAELEGYEMLAERLGREAADRLITPIANTLLRNSRRADRVARVGVVRFHVLLPKTDEIAAINYIERVREETDDWLAAGAVASRLAIGWASPGTGTSFADAMRVAEERMNADRRSRRSS